MRGHVMSKHKILIAIAVVLLGVWGCGKKAGEPGASSSNEGGDESEGGELTAPRGAVQKSGGDSVSATMGPAGGRLDIANGARVEIPPGTLTEATDVVLTVSHGTTAFKNSEHEKAYGPTFEVSPAMAAPDGQSIRISIPLANYPEGWGEVSLGYEYPEGARVGAEDSEHTMWQYENAKLSGGRAVAELAELAGYRLQFVLTNLEAQ
ncbi:MAG TPA: hypothetical protein VK509_00115 [Polyangiales bacterium]|nr:hypothetical protein [Polyangiales bacterium]